MTTPTAATLADEIEGLGEEDPSSWGDYPIDTVLIRSEPRTVHDVLRRIKQGQFVMNPDFQRDFIWDVPKQSKLIESVLMRIPLPVFYLAEDDQGRMIVVDGLQRLSTFERFVKNDLRLVLPDQQDLHGKRFEDLSSKLQNRVEDCNLILYIIDAKVPEQARLDIFDRVNSGVPLTRQQMRNCLYMGPATRFLREEAEKPLFVEVTGGSLRPSVMRDREFVNRFCAFQVLSLETYRDDMDAFLAMSLQKMNEQPGLLDHLSELLSTSLKNNQELFGRHAFRKHQPVQNQRRSVINASLWDVMATGLSRYPSDTVEESRGDIRSAFFALMRDPEFENAITYGTSSVKQVRRRFEMAHGMLKDVLGAHPA